MKTHRGLSAVIGTVFLIAIVVGALSYVTYSLDLLGNFSEQLISEESRIKNVQNEAFQLTYANVTDDDKFDATIKNTGKIPLEITTLWLDKQNENDVVQKISIQKTISPGSSFNFLDENIDIDVDSDSSYSMKFVTGRGESQFFYLNSPSSESLYIKMLAIPESLPTGFASTVLMTVVNNMTDNTTLYNIVPVDPPCSLPECTYLSGPDPLSYPILDPGDTAIFRWAYEISGDPDDTVSFTGSLQNGVFWK